MTQDALTPLQRLENRVDEQDRQIETLILILERQHDRIETLEDDLNKFVNTKRAALGRTIQFQGQDAPIPRSQTETLLSEIVGKAAKRNYND